MRRLAVAVAGVLLALVSCGGGDERSVTKAEWQEEHGAVVADVETALDRTQAATKEGEPTGIRSACELLRDRVEEARDLPAVPDPAAESALRKAWDGLATGAGTCVRSMAQGDARMLERSIVELREARLQLDTAKAALGAP